MALGNASPSAVINGARSARNRQTAVNDQAAEYEYGTSAQTAEDYQAYDSYLKKRQGETVDQGKAITIATKRNSALTGYQSNEIQRQTMAVDAGEQTNSQKYDSLMKLYRQAQATGNQNAVQNLEAKLIGLSKTMQTEALAAGDKATAAGKKAFTQDVNGRLHVNNQGFDILKTAYNANDVIRDEKGQPIKGKLITDPKTGGLSVQIDDNGQPIRVTSRQLAQAKAYNMLQEKNILTQAANSGMDEDGSHQRALDTLTASDAFKNATASGLIERLNREDGGERAFTNKVDPVTGALTSSLRQVTDFNGNENKYATGFLGSPTSASPTALSFDRKNGTSPKDLMDNYTVDSYPILDENKKADPYARKLKDPVTNKTLYAGTSGDSILSPGIPGTIKQDAGDVQAGKTMTPMNYLDPSNFNGPLVNPLDYYGNIDGVGNDLKDAARIAKPLAYGLPGILGAGVKQVQGILGKGVQDRKIAAQQAAAAALAQAKSNQATSAAAVRGTAQAKAIGPTAAPAQVISALDKTPAKTASNPNPLPVQNRIEQAFAVQAKNPVPAPQNNKVWWNPTTWFK